VRRVHELATFDRKILTDFLTHGSPSMASDHLPVGAHVPDHDSSVASGPCPAGRHVPDVEDLGRAMSGPCPQGRRLPDVATNPDAEAPAPASDHNPSVASGPVPDGRASQDLASASFGTRPAGRHVVDGPARVCSEEPCSSTANIELRTSNLELRTSNIEPRTSNLALRTSNIEPRTSNLALRTSNLEPRTSNLAPRTSNLAPRTSNLERFTGRLTPHAILIGFDEAGRGALAGPVVVGCVCFPFLDPSATYAPTTPLNDPTGEMANDTSTQSRNRSTTQPPDNHILESLAGIDDSKRITAKERDRLLPLIKSVSLWAVGAASAREIDSLGIVPAVSLAAHRAYRSLGIKADLLLCDRGISLIRGQATFHAVAKKSSLSPFVGDSSSSDLSPSSRLPLSTSPLVPELPLTRGDSRSLHIAAASIIAKVTRDRIMQTLHRNSFHVKP